MDLMDRFECIVATEAKAAQTAAFPEACTPKIDRECIVEAEP